MEGRRINDKYKIAAVNLDGDELILNMSFEDGPLEFMKAFKVMLIWYGFAIQTVDEIIKKEENED